MFLAKIGSKRFEQEERASIGRSGAAQAIHLLLIDDHRISLEAFSRFLSAQTNFEVRTLLNDELRSARKLKQRSPIAIVHMRMQNPDSVTAVKLLLGAMPKAKIIAFGALDDRERVLSMLRAGVCGFVSQTSSPAELFRAIRRVNRGEGFICPSISKMIVEEFKRGARCSPTHEKMKLSDSERKMLLLIADGRSNKEMASTLGISVRTIEKYRELLMEKLHIKSIAGLTKFAIRAGIARLD